MVYKKTFFPCGFKICCNFLGYAENTGAHRLDFKETVKEKVYLNPLEIRVLLDNLPWYYNHDSGSATCHSIKEGFANAACLVTACRLVVSGEKFL